MFIGQILKAYVSLCAKVHNATHFSAGTNGAHSRTNVYFAYPCSIGTSNS